MGQELPFEVKKKIPRTVTEGFRSVRAFFLSEKEQEKESGKESVS